MQEEITDDNVDGLVTSLALIPVISVAAASSEFNEEPGVETGDEMEELRV